MDDSSNRLLRYLGDAHAAEVGIAEALEAMVSGTTHPEVRAEFQTHLFQTKEQAIRLERRLRELGGAPSGTMGFINQMLARMGDMMHVTQDEWERTTQYLVKAYGTEHLEIGMYAALAEYAHTAGDQETADLALSLLQEEQQAADRLRPLIGFVARDTYNANMQMAA